MNIEDYEIVNADCLETLKNIGDNSIDLLITDPPYNLGEFMKKRQTNLKQMRNNVFVTAGWDNDSYEVWYEHMRRFLSEASRVLKKKGSLIVFMSIIRVESIIKCTEGTKLYYKTTGIWHKKNPMPRNMNLHYINSTEAWMYFVNDSKTGTFNNNGKAIHDYIETGLTKGSEKKYGKHPTQKPEELIEKFIEILSNKDDIVIDCFMGTGTTGVVAKRLERKFIGIELEEKYFNIAKNRMEDIKDSSKKLVKKKKKSLEIVDKQIQMTIESEVAISEL